MKKVYLIGFRIMKMLEKFFESILWNSRLFLIIAVFASVASSVLLIFLGTYDIILVFKKAFVAIGDYKYYETVQKEFLGKVIGAIDNYLISSVLLIFGLGLYELFIGKIENAENDEKSSKILVVHSLDQLKDKIAKVVIMVLIVTFFKYSLTQKIWDMYNLLLLAIGTLLVSLALFFIGKKGGNGDDEH
ncbi:MAG: YqhA family protein [Calditerrivibrio sp.]|nr:YqhA family protein [Calditerrivibrio sp.]